MVKITPKNITDFKISTCLAPKTTCQGELGELGRVEFVYPILNINVYLVN